MTRLPGGSVEFAYGILTLNIPFSKVEYLYVVFFLKTFFLLTETGLVLFFEAFKFALSIHSKQAKSS